jgi:hypothetical protein
MKRGRRWRKGLLRVGTLVDASDGRFIDLDFDVVGDLEA